MQNSLYQQAITEVYISLELLIECNLFGTIPVLWRSKLEIINWRRAKTDMDGGEIFVAFSICRARAWLGSVWSWAQPTVGIQT